MPDRIFDIGEWREHFAEVERDAPGFWKRHPLRAMARVRGGYQFGYEIEGYGTVVGHCASHRPHKTAGDAASCGQRFLRGEPARLIDRMPWRRER